MKKKIILLIAIVCIVAGIGITVAVIESNKTSPAGVWWWDDTLETETYLNFAVENDINEIYYCADDFDDQTKVFISKARSKNIKVFYLTGKYQWLEDNTQLIQQINAYVAYQKENSDAKFCGIHLDIEPHQSPDFETNRHELIFNLIDLANTLKETFPTIRFDFDLPFWLDDEITYNNQTKPAYQHMIDLANRIFVMSYRDSAEAILDIAKEEIAYAKKTNKPLVLCVETYSTEGDNVSFMEEGKQTLQEEIGKLKKEIPKNFGISIHHIKTWHELKD